MHEAMIEAGATAGIMDFAGEMKFFGPGPENGMWPILLKDPYDPSRSYAYLRLPTRRPVDVQLLRAVGGDRRPEVRTRHRPPHRAADLGDGERYRLHERGRRRRHPRHRPVRRELPDRPAVHGGHGDREPVSELNAIIVPEPPEGDNALVTVTNGMRPYVVRLQRPFRPPPPELD